VKKDKSKKDCFRDEDRTHQLVKFYVCQEHW